MRRCPILVLSLAALGVLAAGCAGTAPDVARAPETSRGGLLSEEAEGRAFLLMLSDRRFYEPFTVRRLLTTLPELRPELARALGRIGHPAARPALEALLEDAQPEVRREAAFALGLLGAGAEPAPLLAALSDPDPEVGALAVEALARMGVALARVEAELEAVPVGEPWPRLLPALFRFQPAEIGPVALRALTEGPPELRSRAAFALCRRAPQASLTTVRTLLADADPWLRGWAARGLGVAGDRSDLERLAALLDDASPGPVIQSLYAARNLISSGRAAPPADWLPRLERLMGDEQVGVRIAAMEAAGAWLRNPTLSEALRHYARQGSRWEREVALRALTSGRDPVAADLIAEAARSSEPVLRARAAEAAGDLGARGVLERLRDDREAGVRLAVLAELLEPGDEAATAAARAALGDDDPAVRAVALDWLAANPVLPVEELRRPLADSSARYLADVGLSGVDALRERALSEPRERGLIVAMLEQLQRAWDYPVRRRAAAALGELGRPLPPPGEFETDRGIADYRELARRIREPRFAELETRHGVLRLRIHCPEAPLTCENFLQLANQRFYDGLTFHRVVPDFVVQAGDPRGDGWGGPGYTLRDEKNRLPFGRGAIGMALSGSDTAGSQFFITLSPQPHLEGEFTLFGTVVGGDRVLDLIEQGDVIQRLAEVEDGGG